MGSWIRCRDAVGTNRRAGDLSILRQTSRDLAIRLCGVTPGNRTGEGTMNEFFAVCGVLALAGLNTVALLALVSWALYHLDR